MEMKQLKQESIQVIENQALNHVFYATDIEKNLYSVKEFEWKQQVQLLSVEQVLSYLNRLEQEQKLNPMVLDNAFRYANFLGDFSGNFLQNALKIKKASPFPVRMNERFYQCEDFFDILRAFAEKETVSEEKVNSWFETEFSVTKEIVDSTSYSDGLLFQKVFLKYCNYLLRSKSPLLQDAMFQHKILRMLRFNQMHEEFNGICDTIPTLEPAFFQLNRRLARKISNINCD